MNKILNDLDIETVLQCPVCFELPQNIIHLCKVGHHMCDKCRKRLTSCPTCKSAIIGCRNFLAEALISKFSTFTLNGRVGDTSNNNPSTSGGGDGATLSDGQLQENDKELVPLPTARGVYNCLLEACRNRNSMGAGELHNHLTNFHSHIYEKFQNSQSTFVHTFENFCFLKKKQKYHQAFHVSNMGVFFLNMERLVDDYINCWLSIPAPVKKSNRFDYEIEFMNEDNSQKLKFTSKVASNLQSTTGLLQRGRVFIIAPEEMRLNTGDVFSLLLKIVYKAPS